MESNVDDSLQLFGQWLHRKEERMVKRDKNRNKQVKRAKTWRKSNESKCSAS